MEIWSKEDNNIPKDLKENIHVHKITENTNYIFKSEVTAVKSIENKYETEGDKLVFEDGEKNSEMFDFFKISNKEWCSNYNLLPFDYFRTKEKIIESTIKTNECDVKEVCPNVTAKEI